MSVTVDATGEAKTVESLRPEYTDSHALIIGINEYQHTSPLHYAVSDAEAIASRLIERFGFPAANVTRLIDGTATRDAIREAYLSLAGDGTAPDDRVLVFYAGHGHTIFGRRGEVGYLVPHDGDPGQLATLLRWDDLTKDAELIQAKHLFFLMDACYGGLAFRRGLAPGANRLLRDMMMRPVRQLLTAGKGNEQVSDAGGPLPKHSIFTGHLLMGLDGEAATSDGTITANGLMSYTYQRVGSDYGSDQTPHFGFLEGEGDFVFEPLKCDSEANVFIEVPAVVATESKAAESVTELLKSQLLDPTKGIIIEQAITQEVRKVLGAIGEDRLSMHDSDMSPEAINARLGHYEEHTRALRGALAIIGRWGQLHHAPIAQRTFARLIESIPQANGKAGWLALQYYPSILCFYCFGIAAIETKNFTMLHEVMYMQLAKNQSARAEGRFIVALVKGMLDIARHDVFKVLPEHNKKYVPRSEYLFELLQPELDDLLFTGPAYEALFDRYEVFQALVYLDLDDRRWAPPGRYWWKMRHFGSDEFNALVEDAAAKGEQWPPLLAGFFGGSIDKFNERVEQFKEFVGMPDYH